MNETAQIFGIKKENRADGTHVRYVINIFKLKIAMNFKRKTDNGQNNKILWEKNGVYKKYKNSKKGLSINVTGNNNTVIVNSEIKFHNTKIIVHGENNTVIIKHSNKYIDNLCIFAAYNRKNRKVYIDEGVSVNGADISVCDTNSEVIIGKDCMLSCGITIRCDDAHKIRDLKSGEVINKGNYCRIGNHVWIGQQAFIGKNTEIPDNAIIGAHAVVTKSFTENNVVIAGNPAKIVKRGVVWSREGATD